MTGVRRALPLVVVSVVILAVAVLSGRQDSRDGPPLDPRSTGPLGTAGLVETLRALGARVDVSPDVPDDGGAVALILADALEPAQRDDLAAWVRRGGRLVVTDVASPLAARPAAGPGELFGSVGAPQCPLPALSAIGSVDAPGAVALRAPAGAATCFPFGEGHWLVVTSEGGGAVVSLGGPEVWTNRRIGRADNALLAVALLAPTAPASVVILQPARPGEGEATLGDIVDPRVPAALLQGGLAFLAFAVWRARRLGAPAPEPRLVTIPAAELVVAAGNLYEQAGARARAAELLREDFRDLLARHAAVPPSAEDEVREVLARADPRDDRSLTALAQDLERLRRRIQGADRAP